MFPIEVQHSPSQVRRVFGCTPWPHGWQTCWIYGGNLKQLEIAPSVCPVPRFGAAKNLSKSAETCWDMLMHADAFWYVSRSMSTSTLKDPVRPVSKLFAEPAQIGLPKMAPGWWLWDPNICWSSRAHHGAEAMKFRNSGLPCFTKKENGSHLKVSVYFWGLRYLLMSTTWFRTTRVKMSPICHVTADAVPSTMAPS